MKMAILIQHLFKSVLGMIPDIQFNNFKFPELQEFQYS